MARPSKSGLPKGLSCNNGTYYLRITGKPAVNLGKSKTKALQEYARLNPAYGQTSQTVRDLLPLYQQSRMFRELSENTQKRYGWAFGPLLQSFGEVPVADIEPSDVYNYMEARADAGAPAAANTERAVLAKAMQHALNIGWIRFNPVSQIKNLPAGKKRERVLSDAEFKKLMLAANPVVRLAIRLDSMIGVRVGDLLGIKWGDIRDGYLHMEQDKNKVKQRYELTPEVKAVLKELRKLHGRTVLPRAGLHIFHNRKQQPYTYSGFRTMFNRARAKVGLDEGALRVTMHDVRRSAITAAAEVFNHPAEFSGHRSKRQAEEYVINDGKIVQPLEGK